VVTRPGRDAAERLLAGAIALLPAGRREWGRAMRAELAGIQPRGERRRFALGCVRVVAVEPAVLRGAGYPVLTAGVVVAILWWTSTIAYAPLHWGLVGGVLVLVAVSWLGRRSGPFGPAGDSWAARLVRLAGHLLVGALAAAAVVSAPSHGDPGEQARNGVPIFTVLLSTYLLGFLAVTARRSAANPRVLIAAAASGGGAAVLWAAAALSFPPIPASVGVALVVTAAAAVVAASASAGHGGRSEHRLLAALCAATFAALLIVMLVVGLSSYGPPSLIPDLAPAALTPADDLAQSRDEVVDPYVALLLLGCLLAGALSVASVATRRQAPEAAPDPGVAAML
jgi:hypothetical protein